MGQQVEALATNTDFNPQDPIWQKENTDSYKLSSNSIHSMVGGCTHTNKQINK